ncbi:MAG: N-acetylmuramoyl-L-alanine amidase [Pseudomonadota bacterium]|nr:N-acetylmuramoyl-L-alanine amidase [Pseudomonadota bacterium]
MALLALTGPPALAEEPAPVAAAAHLLDEGESARLSFDLSAPLNGRAREIQAPDRIVLDMPEVDFRLSPGAGHVAGARPDALVKAFRFGLFGPGKSRVVIDLARPACVSKIDTRRLVHNRAASRLTLELRSCSPEAFAAAALDHAPPQAAAEPAPVETTAKTGLPVIVLDPGHGGIDGGAFGVDGAAEKSLVYAFADALRAKLEASGRYHVVMTRVGDQYVSLEDRVAKARAANASLMVSIHADTLKEAAGVSGATVYTCSDRASDAEAARIAERENDSDRQAGEEHKAADPGVADILFDLRRRETRAYAHKFSHGLVARLTEAGALNHNPERSAGFVVLKAPDFPSVLVELGYLSNAHDVANLKSPEWRDKTTEAMRTAIDGFFAKSDAAGDSLAARAPDAAKPSP